MSTWSREGIGSDALSGVNVWREEEDDAMFTISVEVLIDSEGG